MTEFDTTPRPSALAGDVQRRIQLAQQRLGQAEAEFSSRGLALTQGEAADLNQNVRGLPSLGGGASLPPSPTSLFPGLNLTPAENPEPVEDDVEFLDIVGEASKSVGRVPGQLVEGAGGLVLTVAQGLRNAGRLLEPIFGEGVIEEFDDISEVPGRGITEFGRALQAPFTPSKQAAEGGLDSPLWWASVAPGEIVSLAASIIPGIGAAKAARYGGMLGRLGKAASAASFVAPTALREGGVAGAASFDRGIEEGLSVEEAANQAALVGGLTTVGSVALERLPFGAFVLKRSPLAAKRYFADLTRSTMGQGIRRAAITGATVEGVTEAAQESLADSIQFLVENDPDAFENSLQRYVQAAVVGGVIGGGANATMEAFARSDPRRRQDVIDRTIARVRRDLEELGIDTENRRIQGILEQTAENSEAMADLQDQRGRAAFIRSLETIAEARGAFRERQEVAQGDPAPAETQAEAETDDLVDLSQTEGTIADAAEAAPERVRSLEGAVRRGNLPRVDLRETALRIGRGQEEATPTEIEAIVEELREADETGTPDALFDIAQRAAQNLPEESLNSLIDRMVEEFGTDPLGTTDPETFAQALEDFSDAEPGTFTQRIPQEPGTVPPPPENLASLSISDQMEIDQLANPRPDNLTSVATDVETVLRTGSLREGELVSDMPVEILEQIRDLREAAILPNDAVEALLWVDWITEDVANRLLELRARIEGTEVEAGGTVDEPTTSTSFLITLDRAIGTDELLRDVLVRGNPVPSPDGENTSDADLTDIADLAGNLLLRMESPRGQFLERLVEGTPLQSRWVEVGAEITRSLDTADLEAGILHLGVVRDENGEVVGYDPEQLNAFNLSHVDEVMMTLEADFAQNPPEPDEPLNPPPEEEVEEVEEEDVDEETPPPAPEDEEPSPEPDEEETPPSPAEPPQTSRDVALAILRDVLGGEPSIVQSPSPFRQDLQRWAASLGVDLIFVREMTRMGMRVGNTVVANVTPRQENWQLITIVAHELSHVQGFDILPDPTSNVSLFQEAKEAYTSKLHDTVYREALGRGLSEEDANTDALQRVSEFVNRRDGDDLKREATALIISRYLNDGPYRRRVRRVSPSLAQQIQNKVAGIFENFSPSTDEGREVTQRIQSILDEAPFEPEKTPASRMSWVDASDGTFTHALNLFFANQPVRDETKQVLDSDDTFRNALRVWQDSVRNGRPDKESLHFMAASLARLFKDRARRMITNRAVPGEKVDEGLQLDLMTVGLNHVIRFLQDAKARGGRGQLSLFNIDPEKNPRAFLARTGFRVMDQRFSSEKKVEWQEHEALRGLLGMSVTTSRELSLSDLAKFRNDLQPVFEEIERDLSVDAEEKRLDDVRNILREKGHPDPESFTVEDLERAMDEWRFLGRSFPEDLLPEGGPGFFPDPEFLTRDEILNMGLPRLESLAKRLGLSTRGLPRNKAGRRNELATRIQEVQNRMQTSVREEALIVSDADRAMRDMEQVIRTRNPLEETAVSEGREFVTQEDERHRAADPELLAKFASAVRATNAERGEKEQNAAAFRKELTREVDSWFSQVEEGENVTASVRKRIHDILSQMQEDWHTGKMKEFLTEEEIDQVFTHFSTHPLIRPENTRLSLMRKGGSVIALNKLVQGGVIPFPSDIKLYEKVFGREVGEAMREGVSRGEKWKMALLEFWHLPRAIVASVDLSATFRQGLVGWFSHPVLSARAFALQLNALRGKETAERMDEAMREDPDFQFIRDEMGVFLPEVESAAERMDQRAEEYASDIPQRMADAQLTGGLGALITPTQWFFKAIRHSERAYLTFINQQRFKWAKTLIREMKSQGYDPTRDRAEFVRAGSFINSATGRGNVRMLNKSIFNFLMFSPRFVASRFEHIFYRWPKEAFSPNAPAALRKEVVKQVAGASFLIYGLGVMAKGITEALDESEEDISITTDPFDSDFLKFKIGPTRIDVAGGFGQVIRFVIGAGSAFSSFQKDAYVRDPNTGELRRVKNDRDPMSFLNRLKREMFKFKLNPSASFMVSWAQGFEPGSREALTPGRVIKQLMAPITVQSISEYVDHHGVSGLAFLGPEILGLGTSSYVRGGERDNSPTPTDKVLGRVLFNDPEAFVPEEWKEDREEKLQAIYDALYADDEVG